MYIYLAHAADIRDTKFGNHEQWVIRKLLVVFFPKELRDKHGRNFALKIQRDTVTRLP